jgi:hypothetical protein
MFLELPFDRRARHVLQIWDKNPRLRVKARPVPLAGRYRNVRQNFVCARKRTLVGDGFHQSVNISR